VVAAAERAHFLALATPRLRGHAAGLGVQHLALLLDALQVGRLAPTLRHGPARAAGEHFVHLRVAELDVPGASDAGRDVLEEGIGQALLQIGRERLAHQPGVQAAHPAGDVEAHAAGRHHAAGVGVEGRHAADRKTVTPVRVRHRERAGHDAR